MRQIICIILLVICFDGANAFSVVKSITRNPLTMVSTSLSVSIGSRLPDNDLLTKAKECAYSASSTAIEANQYLIRVLELQSNCISGNVESGYKELCQNVDEVAEIVAQLRYKLSSSQELTPMLVTNPGALTVNVPIFASASVLLVGLFVIASFSVIQSQWQTPVIPFTTEEWIYSMKGGYLNLMIMHYVRNGGL